jgi:hypothetical protein
MIRVIFVKYPLLMKKQLIHFVIFLGLISIFCLPANAQEKVLYHQLEIQNGDLLFLGAKPDQLSGAINRVTQRDAEVSFDHVGILEVSGSEVYILHASTENGSVREPLDSLVARTKAKDKEMVLYRLSEEAQSSIPTAIKLAKNMLGKPYNWSYVLNDSTFYCSDFVERAFRPASIFNLEPMTFKNPETGETDSFWVEFYEKLDMEVPEGKLGCNPNGLAANEKLRRIGEL